MIGIRLNADGTRTYLGLAIEMVELHLEKENIIKDTWMITIGLIFFDIEIVL